MIQFINLNFIERTTEKEGPETLYGYIKCNMPESHPHMLEIHDLPKMLYAISVQREHLRFKKWFRTIEVCNTQIRFKIDTGADETCIPQSVYEGLKKKPKLYYPKKKLNSCKSEKLNTCGMFTVALAGKKFEVQDIYVVKDLHQPLLGSVALEALDLI